jgi:N-acyl-D-amino-acid deacylase
LARLRDPAQRAAITHDVAAGLPGCENIYRACGLCAIVLTHASAPRAGDVGQSPAAIAARRACDPWTATMDLLTETALDATMLDHYASGDTVRTTFRHPLHLVGSDGIFGRHRHPRLYGTAPRVLGRDALRERIIPPEEAVARLTAQPAARVGLADRGRIREGLRVDMVLIDPNEFCDAATYQDPQQTPPGWSASGWPVKRCGVAACLPAPGPVASCESQAVEVYDGRRDKPAGVLCG